MMAEWLPDWLPVPLVLVYVSGLGIFAAGLSIIIKVYTWWKGALNTMSQSTYPIII